jgi:hypothetical protein
MDDRGIGVQFLVGRGRKTSRAALGPSQPPTRWVTVAVSPDEGHRRNETGHSLVSRAEFEIGSYT